MTSLDGRVLELLDRAVEGGGPLVVVTGAGISAESGVPTFRGPEGYWTVGSRNYRPEELATYEAFRRMPAEIWAWYLYRRGVCRAARPNAAHLALVELERALRDRFLLVTQNVDGLHLRAGQSAERTYQIHGNVDFLRHEDEHPAIHPLPDGLPIDWPRTRKVGAAEEALLRRGERGPWARPHVLWFDESYDEALFRFESTIDAAQRASAAIVIGTSAATTLPTHVVRIAAQRGIPLLVVNQDPTPFTEVAERAPQGATLRGAASAVVPALAEAILERLR